MAKIIPWLIGGLIIAGIIAYSSPELTEKVKTKIIQENRKLQSELRNDEIITKTPTIKTVVIGNIVNNNSSVDSGEEIRIKGISDELIRLVPLKKDGIVLKDDQGFYIVIENCRGKDRQIKFGEVYEAKGFAKTYTYEDPFDDEKKEDIYFECSESMVKE